MNSNQQWSDNQIDDIIQDEQVSDLFDDEDDDDDYHDPSLLSNFDKVENLKKLIDCLKLLLKKETSQSFKSEIQKRIDAYDNEIVTLLNPIKQKKKSSKTNQKIKSTSKKPESKTKRAYKARKGGPRGPYKKKEKKTYNTANRVGKKRGPYKKKKQNSSKEKQNSSKEKEKQNSSKEKQK